jgi:hypothetical protein
MKLQGSLSAGRNSAPLPLAAREPARRRQKPRQTGGSATASSLLPLLAGSDLQNTKKKHNRQTILIFFHGFRICLSLFSFRSVSL